jgi:hypothetical protein
VSAREISVIKGWSELAVEESNQWHSRLVRERRSRGRAAEQRHELPPLHAITSSAFGFFASAASILCRRRDRQHLRDPGQ